MNDASLTNWRIIRLLALRPFHAEPMDDDAYCGERPLTGNREEHPVLSRGSVRYLTPFVLRANY